MRTSLTKRDDAWRARWWFPETRRWHSQTFRTKKEGERHLRNLRVDYERGQYLDPDGGRTELAAYSAVWLPGQVFRDSTRTTTESRLNNHVLPEFGHRPLGTIRKSEVQAWVKRLSEEGLAATTVEACYGVLRTILKCAVEDRLIATSPCVRIQLPSTHKPPIDPLPSDAVWALRAKMPADLQATVTLGAFAGLRLGEVLGLTQDRVDFLGKTAEIDRQLVLPKSGAPHFAPPKTESSIRTVVLGELVVQELAAHIASHGIGDDGLLFHRNNAPIRRTRHWETWHTARKKTKWPAAKFHDLRHHCASLLIHQGCTVLRVQRQLGHKSAVETLDTYGHLWPDTDDQVRTAVDAALAAPISRPSIAESA